MCNTVLVSDVYFMKRSPQSVNIHLLLQLNIFLVMETLSATFKYTRGIVNDSRCAVHRIPGPTYLIAGGLDLLTPFTQSSPDPCLWPPPSCSLCLGARPLQTPCK